jgi:16S rRNA (cytosine967-C5)-methyltransferase
MIKGDPTREAAYALLTAVFEGRRTLEDALNALPPMEPRDRAAGHRLAAAVLRRSGTLDAVLEPLMRKAPPDPVRQVLRIGAAGLLLLEMPPHAAVGTAVALARTCGLAPFAGLVNAVLRKVATDGLAVLETLDSPRLDTPSWLWASWGTEARVIAEAHQHEAPLDLTIGPSWWLEGEILNSSDAGNPSDAAATLVPDACVRLPTGSARYPAGTHVAAVPGFTEGHLWVQDAAAALPALLLAPKPGERIADLCAAPGGKTAQLAASGAQVTAVERDPARLARLAENLARWRLSANLVQADVVTWSPPELFDAVLLDAPCSATGTIRRHPDVPHLKRPRDIAVLCDNQDKLLAAASRLLRPGGRLIYAVCSLQPEEGAPRLAASGLRPDPFRKSECPGLPEAITSEGYLRTHPAMWRDWGGMDGFFAARLVKDQGASA